MAIFTIHAASLETARDSFAKIGKIGELEATESAGRHWLSRLEEQWLLIIDNADDPELDLQGLFPYNDRAHILVTTRNPNFRREGTVGCLELKGLKESEALHLLLKRADIPGPWDASTESVGNAITKTLGYLALALIQAGNCIYRGICGLNEYLSLHFAYKERRQTEEDDLVRTVYSTFELSLNHLQVKVTTASQDATELLKVLGFYHFEHIRVDIFIRAAANRRSSFDLPAAKPALPRLQEAIMKRLQPPCLLPRFLKEDTDSLHPFRVTRAISELQSLSLISYDGKGTNCDGNYESFSLHPLVHAWARDRLTAGEKKLWAGIALNTLTQSVQLPPADVGEVHGEFRRDVLPHLDTCLATCDVKIADRGDPLARIQLSLAKFFQQTLLLIIRDQVINAAKCGYVYAERGHFEKAAHYLSIVKDTLIQALGYEDEKTMKAMLGLAGTFWGLGRLEEAITLQKRVVKVRAKVYGPNHMETLLAMDQLGKSHWLHGQYHEALNLQATTTKGMKATLGPNHEHTLAALDNFGVTLGSWHRFQESEAVHRQVLSSRKETLGPKHLDTLATMNNLAMALLDLGRMDEAKSIMLEVHEQRQKQLGREHPWTLWALCNLEKINIELGHEFLGEAEAMLTWGVVAGERSLSKDHLGVLMGRGHLARVYARQGHLDKAEELSRDTIHRVEKSRGAAHPDCVYGLWKLAQLYELKGGIGRAIGTCETALERIDMRLTKAHPMNETIETLLHSLQDRLRHTQPNHKDLPVADGNAVEGLKNRLTRTHHHRTW